MSEEWILFISEGDLNPKGTFEEECKEQETIINYLETINNQQLTTNQQPKTDNRLR